MPILRVTSHHVRPCRARSTVLIRGPNHAYKMWRETKRGSFASSSPYPQFLKTLLKKGRHIKQQGNYYVSIVGYNNTSFVTCSETIQDMHCIRRSASSTGDWSCCMLSSAQLWIFMHAIHYCPCIAGWEWSALHAFPKTFHARNYRSVFPVALCFGLMARMLLCPWELVLRV